MSWNQLPTHTRIELQGRLTKRQLDILTLHLAGCSQRRIATMLNLDRSTVRDHLAIGLTKLENIA